MTIAVPIPVTVLGGFLGAGKTTALNDLLSRATQRIAVLVNDFGAINVDAALIAGRGAGMIALANGCVCCALGPDLGEGVARLMALDPPPAQIVVEASGVSDPWRIAQLVRLEAGAVLDAVLVMADAVRFPALLADPWLADTLARQVARADIVVLSHTDLASPAQLAATRHALHRLRPGLPIGDGGLPGLLGFVHGAPERFLAEAVHAFRTWHWVPPASFGRAGLAGVLDALPDSVLRLKGFCRVDGVAQVLQRAGRRWTLTAWDGDAANVLVAIGTPDMPHDLSARFAGAMVPNRPTLD